MNRIICWFQTIKMSIPNVLRGSYPIIGHPYYETYVNEAVQILRCMRCGHESVGYYIEVPEPPTERVDEARA